MVALFQAQVWCDACGERLAAELPAPDHPDDTDTDDYPALGYPAEPTDTIEHCASRDECLNALDLTEWGEIDELHGAETRRIGALLTDELTEYGAGDLKAMLAEPNPTPYQRALHAFWRAAFADYL